MGHRVGFGSGYIGFGSHRVMVDYGSGSGHLWVGLVGSISKSGLGWSGRFFGSGRVRIVVGSGYQFKLN